MRNGEERKGKRNRNSSKQQCALAVTHTDTTAMVGNEALYDICYRDKNFSSLSMRMMKSEFDNAYGYRHSLSDDIVLVCCRMRSLLYMESFRWQPLRVSCLRQDIITRVRITSSSRRLNKFADLTHSECASRFTGY